MKSLLRILQSGLSCLVPILLPAGEIRILDATGPQIQIGVTGEAGTTYELLYSSQLDGNWFVYDSLVGTGSEEGLSYERNLFPAKYFFAVGEEPVFPGTSRVSVNVAAYGSGPTPPLEDVTINHGFNGSLEVGWNEVGWDVDYSDALSLAEVRDRIQNADTWAANSNASGSYNRHLERYHFWPNVINLTRVYHLEFSLYQEILTKLLDREDNADATDLQNLVDSAQASGERVFLIRDFIERVTVGNRLLVEVHFSALINLDAPWAVEVQSHGRESAGLGIMSDPRLPLLEDILQNRLPDNVPAEAWDLCLRGNFNPFASDAVNVDRMNDSGVQEYHIRRMELLCGATGTSAFPEHPLEPPEYPCLFAGVPAIFKDDIPPPTEKIPPWRPGQPGDGPDPDDPTGDPVIGEPFGPPTDRIPVDPEGPDLPPAEGDAEAPPPTSGGPDCPPANGEELEPEINAKIEAILGEMSAEIDAINADVQTWADHFVWGWPDNDGDIVFHDPVLQDLFEQFKAQVDAKRAVIQGYLDDIEADQDFIKQKQQELGTLGLLALGMRENFWVNMITIGGEWSQVSINCIPALIPAGTMPTEATVITADMQREFQKDLYGALMNGASWDEAVDTAVQNAPGDSVMKVVWRGYAQCLKKLAIEQLEIFMALYLPEAQVATAIEIMFEGRRKMPPELEACAQELEQFLENQRPLWDELWANIEDCRKQIAGIHQQFHEAFKEHKSQVGLEARAKGKQKEEILRSFIAYLTGGWDAGTVDGINALPRIVVLPGWPELFCEMLQEILEDPDCAAIPCLPEYITALLEWNCPPPESPEGL